jgi:hypothetical protein
LAYGCLVGVCGSVPILCYLPEEAVCFASSVHLGMRCDISFARLSTVYPVMSFPANKRGAGKGGFALLFHVVGSWSALPDRER